MAKVNPKRIPRSQADVDRAREDGQTAGIMLCIYVFLYVLVDKFGFTREQISEVNRWFNTNIKCVLSGDIKMDDVKKLLIDEYDVQIDLR